MHIKPATIHRFRQSVFALALLAPALAQAASPALQNLLSDSQADYVRRALVVSHERAYASLATGQSQTIRATIHPNSSYVIHADCTWPCSDVDLYVYNAEGNVVASDAGAGRAASVVIDSNQAEVVEYSVRMSKCGSYQCEAGAFLMESPTSALRSEGRTSSGSPAWTSEDSKAVLAAGAMIGIAAWAISAFGGPNSPDETDWRDQSDREFESARRAQQATGW